MKLDHQVLIAYRPSKIIIVFHFVDFNRPKLWIINKDKAVCPAMLNRASRKLNNILQQLQPRKGDGKLGF